MSRVDSLSLILDDPSFADLNLRDDVVIIDEYATCSRGMMNAILSIRVTALDVRLAEFSASIEAFKLSARDSGYRESSDPSVPRRFEQPSRAVADQVLGLRCAFARARSSPPPKFSTYQGAF